MNRTSLLWQQTERPTFVLGALLLLLLALLSGGCGGTASPDQHLARAKTALADGDFRTAEIELKNALRANPEHAGARALLGQALMHQGNAAAATQELERAQTLGAEFSLIQPWLADAWLQSGNYTKVIELNIEDAPAGAKLARMLSLQSRALLATGDLEAADAKAISAIETDPALPAATLAMAQVQFARQHFDQARAFIEKTLATAPTDAEANTLLGQIERQSGDLDAAEAAFTAAMQDQTAAPGAQLNRVYTRIQQKNYAGAQEDIAQLRETLKANALVDYAEGLLLYSQAQYRPAIKRIEAALGESPNLRPALRLAGATRLALEEPQLARVHLERFLSAQPEDRDAQRMLAMALLQLGEAEKAETMARALVVQDSADVAAMDLLAGALMMQGKRKEGTDYLRQVKAAAPSSPTLDTRLGLALLDQGDQEEGLQLLRETAEQNPESADAVEKLVAGLASTGDLDAALSTANVYQQQHPDSAHAHNLVAAVYLQQNANKQARAAFKTALEAEPGNLTASRALAALAFQTQDYLLASDTLKTSLSHHPEDLSLLISLAKLGFAQDDADTAKMYLDQALESHPDNIAPKLYMSAYFLRQGNPREALSFAVDGVALDPENATALGLRADAQMELEDYQAARSSLQDMTALLDNPNPRVLWALARTDLALGNTEDAKRALEEAHAAAPDFTPALLTLGRLAIAQQNVASAAEYLSALKEQLGENHRDVLLMQGDLARLQGNQVAADEAFRSLLDADAELNLDEDSALWSATEQHILTYIREGDPEAGLKSALELQDRQPDSARLQTLLGQLYLRDEQLEKATEAFEQALKLDPGNAKATNGLVAMAVRAENVDQAKALYTTALKLNPSDLELLIGSARLALLQDDPQGAETFLLEGVEKNPESSAAKLYLGAFYLGQNQPAKALKLVSALGMDLDKTPRLLALKAEAEIRLNQFRTAIRTLENLRRLQPDQPRILLSLANTQARLDELTAAKATLKQVLALEPQSVPALRGLVRIAIAENSQEEGRQLIAKLKEQLGAEHDDVLLLEGQLAEQNSDPALALSKYRRLFNQSPTSASLLLVARALMRQDDMDATRIALEDWLGKHPQDNRIRFELAQLELNEGKSDQAIVQYQTLLDAGMDNPLVLNNLAWLLKDRDMNKALGYARQAHEAAPASANIADTLAVLLLAQDDLAEARRAIAIALQAEPENASMLYHKALILSEQGEQKEATKLVEQALEVSAENKADFPDREEAQSWLDRQSTSGN